jgi:hypothetical protein
VSAAACPTSLLVNSRTLASGVIVATYRTGAEIEYGSFATG